MDTWTFIRDDEREPMHLFHMGYPLKQLLVYLLHKQVLQPFLTLDLHASQVPGPQVPFVHCGLQVDLQLYVSRAYCRKTLQAHWSHALQIIYI